MKKLFIVNEALNLSDINDLKKLRARAESCQRVALASRQAAEKAKAAQRDKLATDLLTQAVQLESVAQNIFSEIEDNLPPDVEKPQAQNSTDLDTSKDPEETVLSDLPDEMTDANDTEDIENIDDSEEDSEEDFEDEDDFEDEEDSEDDDFGEEDSENKEDSENDDDSDDSDSSASLDDLDNLSTLDNSENDSDSDSEDEEDSEDDDENFDEDEEDSENVNNSEENEENFDEDEEDDSEDADKPDESDDIDNSDDLDNSEDNSENSDETTDTEETSETDEETDDSVSSDDSSETTDSDESDGSSEEAEDSESSDETEETEKSSGETEDSESSDETEQAEETEEDDTPVEDPFADDEDIPQLQSPTGEKPRDASLQDIIKRLKKLSPAEKQGAIKALNDLLSDTQQTLTESKALSDMDDDEFGDFINDKLALIDQVDQLDYSDDLDDRKAKINQLADNKMATQELEAEDNVELKKDFQKTKAKENSGAAFKNYRSIRDFYIDFYDAIKNQVDEIEQLDQSYDEINTDYANTNLIVKADVLRRYPDEAKPIIDLYFDASGSWTSDSKAMEIGKRTVASMQEFVDRDEIVLNIFYFSDANKDGFAQSLSDSRLGGGTLSWRAILQNIKATDAKNVVLMTDRDMEGQAGGLNQTCRVAGNVWFIWRLDTINTMGGSEIAKHLIGDAGTYQYSFGSNEQN